MAGIYIHIPFCKQACSYCNFHFSTSSKNRQRILDAMLKEIEDRADFFIDEQVQSVYFGGGTPSILDQSELSQIFKKLETHFDLSRLKEVTLEANPDDLSQKKLQELRNTPVNRLSIGVQSLHQKDLDFMNRAHNAEEGIKSVERALAAGFEKLSLDLIFGIPNSTNQEWEDNLKKIFQLDFDHLSAYALTMEEGTLFHHLVKNGKVRELEDHQVAEQYELLQEYSLTHGWEQYELSNFCKADQVALHNTAYWMNHKYLGIGPSAHSYDGKTRRWNIGNNHLYCNQMEKGEAYYDTEVLSEKDRYHELLISRLRTKWGIQKAYLEQHFSPACNRHFRQALEKLDPLLEINDGTVKIKRPFWFTSDQVLGVMMMD